MNQLPTPLRGIIPPMVTPLLDRDTLDRESCVLLVESMIAAGVSGIFVLGTTGEGPGLSYRLRREMVTYVCHVVNGRVPVLVGITDTTMVETLNLARHAADVGAAALVLAPPYYFPIDQTELLGYIERLAPELPLPVYLYNIPFHTKTHFAPDTVRAAADIPNVYGVKDSSGDMDYFGELCAALSDRRDFTILCGPEELLVEAMEKGAHGGISGGANIAPALYVQLYRAIVSGDGRRVAELEQRVLEISDRIYHVAPGVSTYLRSMKCAVSHLGRCKNVMAEPYQPLGPVEDEAIAQAVRQIEGKLASLLEPTQILSTP